MKKLIVLIIIILNISACANNSDESLSHDDFTLLHFGQVIEYYPDDDYIEVAVGHVTKGEHFGKRASYSNISKVGEFEIKHGGKYLIAYTDENSPVYIINGNN